jgi:phosphatidylserine/phosphatidylglycerophosphate/cardiolipin synthase-like enzyme
MSFDWDLTQRYRAGGRPWPTGYPDDQRSFFSPVDGDGIHRLLVDLVTGAEHSLVLNMYGYADVAVDTEIQAKATDARVYVQMSLDSSQAAGAHEREILARWNHDAVGTSIAIGRSARNAISHLKVLIVDGLYVVTGSTNFSISGETLQDNQLLLIRNALVAAQYRSILDVTHDLMLKAMAARSRPTPGGCPS